MDQHTPQLGDLRSLLAAPSKNNWTKLLKLLIRWPAPDELVEVILPYCHQALKRWPDEPRRLNTLTRSTKAQLSPLQHTLVSWLCHELELGPETELSPAWQIPPLWDHLKLIAQLHDDHEEHILAHSTSWRALSLVNCELSLEQAYALLDWPIYDELHTIALTDYGYEDNQGANLWLAEVFLNKPLTQLRHLNLSSHRQLPPELLYTIFQSPSTANLITLDLNDCYIEDECLEILIDAPYLQHLERLDLRYNWRLDRDLIDELQQQPWLRQKLQGQDYDNIWE